MEYEFIYLCKKMKKNEKVTIREKMKQKENTYKYILIINILQFNVLVVQPEIYLYLIHLGHD